MDLKSIEINKVEFSVRISGQGRSFIWGHGLTSSMEGEDAQNIFRWNEFPKTIQLVRYDARGHGATAASKEPHHYHWRSLAEDMTAIADALHIDTFVAGGQSMGCATAIYAALKVPRRIEGLILVTPPTAWEKRKRMSDSYRKMAETSALLGGRLLANSAIRGLINDPPDWLVGAPEEKLRSTTEGLKTMDRKTLSVLYKGAALADLPPRDVIRSIKIPALILAWTGDPGHPLEIAMELGELLPHSNLVIAEDYADVEKWPRVMQNFFLGPAQK